MQFGFIKNKPIQISILFIIIFNFFLVTSLNLTLFDQLLNILLSIGIFEYFKNQQLNINKRINLFDTLLSISILFFTLYRSFWSYSVSDDKFTYFVLTLLLISLLIINFSSKNLIKHFKVIFTTSIFIIKEFIYIPLSILLTPISTIITWFIINLLGVDAYTKGQEIFIGRGGVDITFGCSGSDQIIFTIASMYVLNLLIPFKKINVFYLQLIISFLITFFVNILRLLILAISVDSYNSSNFSIFDFFHGPRGSLIFALISTVLCCEIYKKLYRSSKLFYE